MNAAKAAKVAVGVSRIIFKIIAYDEKSFSPAAMPSLDSDSNA
jgi:hypothetical protein